MKKKDSVKKVVSNEWAKTGLLLMFRASPQEFFEALKALSSGDFATWSKQKQEGAFKTSGEIVYEYTDKPIQVDFLDAAVRLCLLDKLPPELLNDENILYRDKHGKVVTTLLHDAAERGQYQKIPKHLLTEDNLCRKDHSGDTPLHVCFKHSLGSQVLEHPDVLSLEVLTSRDSGGKQIWEMLLEAPFNPGAKDNQFGEKEYGQKLLEVLPRILDNIGPERINRLEDVRGLFSEHYSTKRLEGLLDAAIEDGRLDFIGVDGGWDKKTYMEWVTPDPGLIKAVDDVFRKFIEKHRGKTKSRGTEEPQEAFSGIS